MERKEADLTDKDMILIGDFNIPRVNDRLHRAITSEALKIPNTLQGFTAQILLKKYSQILHYSKGINLFSNRECLIFIAGEYPNLKANQRL